MKWVIAVLSSIALTLLVVILSLQTVRITNLERELTKSRAIEELLCKEIEECSNENKRYLDSCLNIVVNRIWE